MVGIGFVKLEALGLRGALLTWLDPEVFGCPMFGTAELVVFIIVGILALAGLLDDCWDVSLGQILA